MKFETSVITCNNLEDSSQKESEIQLKKVYSSSVFTASACYRGVAQGKGEQKHSLNVLLKYKEKYSIFSCLWFSVLWQYSR